VLEQSAVQPEAIATGLVAGVDRTVLGQAELASGQLDLSGQRAAVAGVDGAATHLAAVPETQQPFALAQLEGQEQTVVDMGRVRWVGVFS